MSPNEINDLVLEAHQKGYQVAIHARGIMGLMWRSMRSSMPWEVSEEESKTPDRTLSMCDF
jgi:hypothetical protein